MNNLSTKQVVARYGKFVKDGAPKMLRIYDLGADTQYLDRYTIVFTGRYRNLTGGEFIYISCGHGMYQHGSHDTQIDVNKSGFAPKVGGKNHLGTRILFSELPKELQVQVMAEYLEFWDLPNLQPLI